MNTRTLDGQLPLPLVDAGVDARLACAVTPGWQTRAACNGEPGDAFFPEPDDATATATTAALAMCTGCRVRSACRAAALLGDEHGIWGGTTEDDRARMHAALASGTPVDVVLLATNAYRGRDAA